MKKTSGILIIAAGHPNYGRMAFNLAVSLKTADPTVEIALAMTSSALDHIDHYPIHQYFNHFITIPPDAITRGVATEFIKAKTWMYDLSPFDTTLFLDADMLWHPKHAPSKLLKEIKEPLTFQNRGCLDISASVLDSKFSMWADVNEVKSKYKFTGGFYYQIHSECVIFKKSPKVKAFFDHAKQNYDTLKVKHFNFAGAIPDELPFAIAMLQTGMYPHKKNWTPIYWEVTEKKMLHNNPSRLYNDYYGYSTGGSFHNKSMKEFYNNLANYYFKKSNLHHPYMLQNKRDFIPERANL